MTLATEGSPGTAAARDGSAPVVEMAGISKAYGGAVALDDVSISVKPGRVLALCGANGAGKSTLVRVLAGAESPDTGTIRVNGVDVAIKAPADAFALGLKFIHQELNLVPKFTALQNMSMEYPGGSRAGFLNRRASRQRAREVLEQLGGRFRLDAPVEKLSVADRWLVALGRSLMRHAQLIAMDEPTASFGEEEAQRLFDIVDELKSSGVGVIYISHRLDEVLQVSDEVAVLRDGKVVAHHEASALDVESLTHSIIGRRIEDRGAPATVADRKHRTVLSVNGLAREPRVRGVNLDIREGEILGIAGLVGSGRTELANLLFGVDQPSRGEMQLNGAAYRPRSPHDAIKQGVAMVPEERRSEALLLRESVVRNTCLATLAQDRGRLGLISPARARKKAENTAARFHVKLASVRDPVGSLSGGNQQKVVVGRYVLTAPEVLILDEPTVGVDVGARQEIHAILRELAHAGSAVVVISSDFEEFAMCERVAVMREGRVVEVLNGADASKDRLTSLCYSIQEDNHD